MNCRQIIEAYLKEHGYDGLCDAGCGCSIDRLFPCIDGPTLSCEPAYKVKGGADSIIDIYTTLEELKQNYVAPEGE